MRDTQGSSANMITKTHAFLTRRLADINPHCARALLGALPSAGGIFMSNGLPCSSASAFSFRHVAHQGHSAGSLPESPAHSQGWHSSTGDPTITSFAQRPWLRVWHRMWIPTTFCARSCNLPSSGVLGREDLHHVILQKILCLEQCVNVSFVEQAVNASTCVPALLRCHGLNRKILSS